MRLYLVGNKVRSHEEVEFIEAGLPDLPLLGYLPADVRVQEADRFGVPVYEHIQSLRVAAQQISETLDQLTNDAAME